MNLEIFLSLRYFLAKKRRSSISIVSIISITCVALSVMILIIVFSVFNGFHQDMKDKILSKESHLVLSPYRTTSLDNYRSLTNKINKVDGVRTALPYIDGQAMIRFMNDVRGVKIRGVDPDLLEKDEDFQTKFKIVDGEFNLEGRNSIVIGEVLSQQTGLAAGDLVSIYVADKGGFDDFLVPLNIQYKVAGVFRADYTEYDQFFVFMSLSDAQTLYGLGDSVSAIGVKLDDYEAAREYRRTLHKLTKGRYTLETWMTMRRNLYTALSTEKVLIAIVLTLLIGMAAFSMASTLIMIVMEKEQEIGILKSIGMPPHSIMRVFLIQGFIVGIAGTLIGLFLGLFVSSSMDTLLSHVESLVNGFQVVYHAVFGDLFDLPAPHPWKLFPAEVYYVTSFPVKMQFWEIFFISLGSVLLTTLCAFIPAKHAARLKVTEVLHKE